MKSQKNLRMALLASAFLALLGAEVIARFLDVSRPVTVALALIPLAVLLIWAALTQRRLPHGS